MNPDIKAQCERILALSKQATAGPWKAVKPGHGHATGYRCVQLGDDDRYSTLELEPEDADFIAAARTIAPQLARVCLELEKRNIGLEILMSEAVSWFGRGLPKGDPDRTHGDVISKRMSDAAHGKTVLTEAQAENKRLREALEVIRERPIGPIELEGIIRKALEGE